MTFDAIRTVAATDSESNIIFVGRESGILEKYHAADISTPLMSFPLHKGAITAIAVVSPDEVYTASIDGTAVQFSTAAEVEGKREIRKISVGSPIRSLLLSGDTLYVGCVNGSIVAVNSSSELSAFPSKHDDAVVALSVQEGVLVSASYDNQIRVWDTATPKCNFRLVGHKNYVKGLFVVSPSTIISVSADETILMWQLPDAEASSGGEAPPPTESDPEVASKASSESLKVPIVFPAATVPFAGTPLASAVAGTLLYFGTSQGQIHCIDTKGFAKAVSDFSTRNEQTLKAEQFRVEKRRVELSNKLRLKGRRAVKAKRKELVEQEKRAASEALAEKARQARELADDDEEVANEEVANDATDGEEVALSAEHEEELLLFKEETEKSTEEGLMKLKAEAAKRIEDCLPIVKLKYSTQAAQFPRLPFTRTFRVDEGSSVVACAVVGKNGFAAVGNRLVNLQVLPGIVAV